MIRIKEQKDNRKVAELVYIIWEGMDLEIIEKFDRETVLEAFEMCLSDEEFRNSERTIHVHEVDGDVAGFVLSYPGHTEHEFKHVWEKLGLDKKFHPYSPPLELREARDNEMYIDSVATFSEYRGQGIATKLLKYLLDSEEARPFGLICEVENEKALSLYLKLGFKKDELLELYGQEYYHMTYVK